VADLNGGSAKLFGVIPAAGEGTRLGAQLPKQYLSIGGRPLLAHALDRLQAALPFETILVALSRDDGHYDRVIGDRAGVEAARCGGKTRGETVRNALALLDGRCSSGDWIVVHDAARPCVPVESLRRLLSELRDDAVGGLLAIPVADTLKRADVAAETSARVECTQDRARIWRAQTPQMFRFALLRQALEGDRGVDATDEAQAIERLGHRPRLVLGSAANVKVTYADDLTLAAAILTSQELPSPPTLPALHRCPTAGEGSIPFPLSPRERGKGRGS
jgi:2-C-methyl-D-erythritol 4-phosphate cytidylyltransferase